MKKNVSSVFLCYLLALIFFCVNPNSVHAERMKAGVFDDRISYNVYFYTSEDNISVIKNTRIVGFKEIGDRLFLEVPF